MHCVELKAAQLEDAKKLVRDAIAGGVFNDLGSGSNVDLCIITAAGVDYIRPYEARQRTRATIITRAQVANVKAPIQNAYRFAPGTTAVLTTSVESLVDVETAVEAL